MIPYIIPILLFFLGLKYPKLKIVTFGYLIYFWVLMGLNTFSPDWKSYENAYDNYLFVGTDSFEIGYLALCGLGNFIGLSYQEFRMCFAAIFVVFVLLASRRLSDYPNYVLALFLLWPFVGGVSGLRQSMANIMVCCAVPCLFNGKNKGIVFYIIWISIAMLIHQSVAFFLVLLFARNKFSSRQERLIIYCTLGLFLIVGASNILGKFSFITDNQKLDTWLNLASDTGKDHQSVMGVLIRAFFVMAYVVVVRYTSNILLRRAFLDERRKNKIIICRNTSFLLILTIPFYIVSGEYQRFLYGALMLYYAVFADFRFLKLNRPIGDDKILLLFMIFTLIGLTGGYYMFSMRSHDVLATLKDNLLFK